MHESSHQKEGTMFGNKNAKTKEVTMANPAPVRTAPVEDQAAKAPKNYISAGTVIEGNIISTEDLRMDGTIKGDIKTTGCLILGKGSNVEGNILASEAEVAGLITGTVESKGSLTIRATCKIFGDIITRSLNVESGSSFNGRCKVGGDADERSAPTSRPAVAAPAAAPAPAAVAARPKV
jgi:cytoskeletal protein CcmA (bactofilin family)